jgi:hypothetical protein
MAESVVTATVEKLLHVKIIGKPSEEAYNSLMVQIAEHIQWHGEIRLLLEVGETASRFDDRFSMALWQYAAVDFIHWESVKRLALIGDPQWALALAVFCQPYTSAKIRHFGPADLLEAKRWATEGSSSNSHPYA